MSGKSQAEPSTAELPVTEGRRLFWADGDRIRQIRIPAALPLVIAGGVLSGLLMLFLTRKYDFYYDEWEYIVYARNWPVLLYFIPHNEHWATIPAVTYRVLLLLFGARTYVPYMVVLAIWNLLAAVFMFLLIRRRSGELPALLAAALFLVFGRGWENLIWADQIGFVGSSALGLLAILLLTGPPSISRGRAWAGAAALMAAFMTQGPALFFFCWLVVQLALDRTARRRLLYLAPPFAIYLVWFAVIGHATIDQHQSPLSLSTLQALPAYVASGIGSSAAGIVGLGYGSSLIAGLVLVGLVAFCWARRRPDWTVIGAAVGLLAEFTIVGLVRSNLGVADAAQPRYVDIAAIFLLVVLADCVSRIRWRSPAAGAVLAVALIGLLLNGLYLHEAASNHYGSAIYPGQVSQQVAWAYRDSPGLDREAYVNPGILPYHTGTYLSERKAQGSQLPNLTPPQLTRYPASLVDAALVQLFPARVKVKTPPGAESCTPEPAAGVLVQGGGTVTLRSDQTGTVAVLLWHESATAPTAPAATVTLTSTQQVVTVRTGDPEPGFEWHVTVVGAPSSHLSICAPPS